MNLLKFLFIKSILCIKFFNYFIRNIKNAHIVQYLYNKQYYYN